MTHKTYSQIREDLLKRYPDGQTRSGVQIDDMVQLRMQNTYNTHLDIARDMASVMRADMAAYDQDHTQSTQSLGCWSGFHAQQMIKSVKRMKGTTKGAYVYLSGWMVAGLRNSFGHLPDQSMHEKTSVVDLIEEIYTSLRQADEVEINDLFAALKSARTSGGDVKAAIAAIDSFETHVVPIIADIDAGFGNEHDGAAEYIKWLDTEPVSDLNPLQEGEVALMQNGTIVRPKRLPNGLYKFKDNTGEARVIEDCISSLTEGGADMLWIETATPNVSRIAGMVNRIRDVVPNAKLTYNNSPSFNWTLNLRQQVREEWIAEGKIKAGDLPDGIELMSSKFDDEALGLETNRRLANFQLDISREAGVFHNLITLPTFHMTAKFMDDLAKGYFGDRRMEAYVNTIQREEIRNGVSAVKHQHEVGSDLGDTFKEMVAGERALKAGGHANTMNQFAQVAQCVKSGPDLPKP